MKTALMALLVLSSFSFSALAATSTVEYGIGEPSVVPAQYGVNPSDVQFCPTPESLVVAQDENLNGLSLTLSQQSEIIGTAASGSSHQCISDMVCLTEDHFDLVNGNGYVSLTRNNDGNYPTTNLPGYSSLSISLTSAPAQKGRVDCYYDIKPLN
jgi:hypothetical protein